MSSSDRESSGGYETEHIALREFDIVCLFLIGILMFFLLNLPGTASINPTRAIADALILGVIAIVLSMLFIGFQLNKIAKSRQ